MNSYHTIVIGVGAMGSSACYHLANRGLRVLGLEQFDIPHSLGSSHGQSRMIRLAYYEHPDYVPLLRRAYDLWDQLESLSNQKLLYRTGGVYIGPPDGEVVSGSLRAARMHNLAHELLDHAELQKRFPQFTVPESWVAVWEPEAGFLTPENVISAYAQAALRNGAQLHGRERVLSWQANPHHVTVRTDKAEYQAEKLIFCGGPWTSNLISDLGVKLLVTRQVWGWVWPKQTDLFALGRLPVWAIDHLDGTLHYGFPLLPDIPGFKIGHHGPGPQTHPDTVPRDPQPGDEQSFRPILTTMIPQADGPLLSLKVCMYTNSPDHHFIIDRHPHHDRVTLACGFSGHGFKFASVVGEILADLATTASTPLPAQFLQLKRLL